MAAVIYRGSTCRIIFKPLDGINVSDLGEPSIAISQELAFLTPDPVVDTENNRVYADLTEEETLTLVDGAETKAQIAYVDTEAESVIRFPVHDIRVESTLMWTLMEEEEEEPTPSPEPGGE